MNSSISGVARRPRVKRDARELRLLSQGNPERITDISVRRLGVGGTGKPEEIEAAARRAFHLLHAAERQS
jgi:hypothetical protein